MKKSNLLLNLLLAMLFIGGFTACKEDDPGLEEKEGLPVADGMYITQVGVDPVATAQLKVAMVDAPDFGAQSREGFVQSYVYLTAGNYNIVEVVDKQIGDVLGGTVESITEVPSADNEECETTEYSLINATVGGAAFAIPKDGLYVVAYDQTQSEIVFDEIVSAAIIGGATPGGWGEDTQMTTTISAEGISATIEGVTLDEGEMKFRFNCRWAIDRRIDSTQPFDNANGYSFFTNYGGSIDQLLPGNEGANIQIAEYAVYTVTLSWDPVEGAVATLTKTGEAEPKPDYPAELYMIGGSLGGWDWAANGLQMIPVNSNPHLFWRVVWLYNDADSPLSPADPGLKFAPVADWNGDFGVDASNVPTDSIWAKGGSNYPGVAESGYYMVVVNLDKDNETVEVVKARVYGIGDAFGSWDKANEANRFTAANGVLTSPPFVADDKDIRVHAWANTFTPVADGPAVDWWQAEFIVLNGTIEYRGNGGDQERVKSVTGQTISLDFKDGTGSIQ